MVIFIQKNDCVVFITFFNLLRKIKECSNAKTLCVLLYMYVRCVKIKKKQYCVSYFQMKIFNKIRWYQEDAVN